MKKCVLLGLLTLCLPGCAVFFAPGFYERIVDDPFRQIGAVVEVYRGTNSSLADLAGALQYAVSLSPRTNSIFIAIDVSDSALPLSRYPEHQPILIGGFGQFRNWQGSALAMADWDYQPGAGQGNNDMTVSPLHPDVYILELNVPVTGTLDSTIQLYLSGSTTGLEFRPGNYLDTPEGRAALSDTDIFWRNIGYREMSGYNYQLILTNIGGILSIHHIQRKDAVPPFTRPNLPVQGDVYLTPDYRGVGIRINTLYDDWSMQGAGLPVLPAGTRIRILWEGLPAGGAIPWSAGVPSWTDWPARAVVTGPQGWLHTDSSAEWDPTLGRTLSIDTGLGLGKCDIVLPFAVHPALSFKIASSGGWGTTPDESPVHSILLPQPRDGAVTVVVQSHLQATNL